jgi:putative membrane protein
MPKYAIVLRMIESFIFRILQNTIALFVATLVPGFHIQGGIKEYLLAGALLAILNWLVKPILKFVSFPIILLTFGLFTLVINAIILRIVDRWFAFMTIDSLTALFLATIVISIVNMLSHHKSEKKD